MHRSGGPAFILHHLFVFMTLKMRYFMADEWVCDPHHTWIRDLSRSPRLLVLFLLRELELQST